MFHRRRGFTLVELLVVIGIIALLLSILLPTLGAAKKHVMATKCASNLRSIGYMMLSYAQDNGGYIPRGYSGGGGPKHLFWAGLFGFYFVRDFPNVDPSSGGYDGAIRPTLEKIGVFRCPAFPTRDQPLCYVINAFDAGSNGSGAEAQTSRLRDLKPPAEIILFTEASAYDNIIYTAQFDHHDVWLANHLPPGPPSERRICDDDRHRGRINNCYVDGHVDSLPIIRDPDPSKDAALWLKSFVAAKP